MLTIPKLEPLFEDFQAPALIFAASEKFEIIEVNDAYLHLLNKQKEELCGQPLFDVFPDQETENPQSAIKVTERTIQQVIASKQQQTSGAIAYQLPDKESKSSRLRFFMPEYMPVIDEIG